MLKKINIYSLYILL